MISTKQPSNKLAMNAEMTNKANSCPRKIVGSCAAGAQFYLLLLFLTPMLNHLI